MGLPGVGLAIAGWMAADAGLKAGLNAAAPSLDELRRGDLIGAAKEYWKGGIQGIGNRMYAGMMQGGYMPIAPGTARVIDGKTKYWDPQYGWQLAKRSPEGIQSKFGPSLHNEKGAGIDPVTGQTRTGNIVDPATLIEPAPSAPTLAATVPPVKTETVDTAQAQRAAQAAAAYKAKQDEDARLAEIHKGYKTMREFGGEPVVTQEYMEQDAMREWAKANPQLAQKLIDKHGLSKDGIFGKESEGNMQYAPATPLTPITPAPVMTADATFNPVSNSIFSAASNINIENLGNIAGLNPQPVQSGFFKAGDAAVAAMPAISALSNTVDMDPEKYREVFSRLSQKN